MFSHAKISKTTISRRRYFKPLVLTLFFWITAPRQNFNHAPRQYRQLRRLPYLYTSDLCKSHKNDTIHESTLKLYRLQRIVKVCPFKDSFNVSLLNVGSYCPSTIVELFTNLSYEYHLLSVGVCGTTRSISFRLGYFQICHR